MNASVALRLWFVSLFLVTVAACEGRSCSAKSVVRTEFATTDGAIAVQNLEAAIEENERAHARSPDQRQFMSTLITFLQMRAQYLGHLADYDRADALAEELVKLQPEDSSSYLQRAGVRSSLHRFPEAEMDLAEAERLGAAGDKVIQMHASLLQAKGQVTQALDRWRQIKDADIEVLGSLAGALGLAGKRGEAEEMFARAKRSYRDVSPFPVAWIEFQRGVMWERAGDLTQARERYEAARAYLPQYAPATGHLASVLSLTDLSRAAELLEPLIGSSDDPEYQSQLAGILLQQGRLTEASRLRDAARARYDALSARHPEAFSDHAARFWMGIEPTKALALAMRNLSVRQTTDAYELALSAALAAGAADSACRLADEALAAPQISNRMDSLARRALQGCGQGPRAQGQVKLPGSVP